MCMYLQTCACMYRTHAGSLSRARFSLSHTHTHPPRLLEDLSLSYTHIHPGGPMFFFSHTHTHALAPRWPKGKMEVGESDAECAIREVYEEIGFNITRRLRASNAISLAIRQHDANGIKTANTLTLFIIPGVSEKTPFRARTLGEISAIEWFPLSQLPAGAAVTGSVEVKREESACGWLGLSWGPCESG